MNRLSWTSLSIIVGLPALLGIVAWLIAILSAPDKWCGVQVADSKIASRPIADCTSIVLQLIHWLGWSTIALIACLCIAFLTIVARDLKAVLDVTGPGNTHFKVGGDAADGAQAVADAATAKSDEIGGATV